VIVILTGTTMLWAGFSLATVTTPEYVPGPKPDGSADIVTAVAPNAPRVLPPPVACSQVPPELVLAVAENVSDPPPLFDTVTGRLTAGPPCTKGNVMDPEFTDRLGCPAAVAVR